MTISLHPEQVAAMYDCLRAFPPFNTMRLPPADEVEFQVRSSPGYYGWHAVKGVGGTRHVIAISSKNVGYLPTLALFLAHEMIHLYQAQNGTATREVQHNAEFRRIAAKACRQLGFDPKVFV